MRRITGFLFLFAAVTTILFSCKQESSVPVNFMNITETDASGDINGMVDSTDWTNDSIWNSTELGLMQFSIPDMPFIDTLIGITSVAPAYPNPGQGKFTLRINTQRQCLMKIVLVNTNYEILFYDIRVLGIGPFIFPGGDTIARAPSPFVIPYDVSGYTAVRKPGYYRLYYAFYSGYNSIGQDSLFYKGHGDLHIIQ